MTSDITITPAEWADLPAEDKRGHKSRERRCLASGQVRPAEEMIRFVLSPDNVVTPDVAGKLPGRGVWVSHDRASLEKAIKTKAFARGFKGKAVVPDDLIDLTEELLAQQALGLLAMARKSGHIFLGFDQVKAAAQTEPLAWRIEASDGSDGPRGKIRVLTKAVSHELEQRETPVIGCFSADDLGKALGRDHIKHAALPAGPLARSMTEIIQRLSGFREIVPDSWPDKHHETPAKAAKKSAY